MGSAADASSSADGAPPPRLSELLKRPDEPIVRRTWPEEQLRSAGLRHIVSQHVSLYTDLPADPEIDALPAIFDQAVPLWAAYFGVSLGDVADWRINAFLMHSQEPFAALSMLPGEREIVTGFATQDNLWINEQTTPYYRRHLWLHEGTHAFMHAFLNRTAPGWYMEGLAELLGTHRLDDGKLEIGIMPHSSRDVPALGRVELVQQDVDAGRVYSVEGIMQLDNRRALSASTYAWCWALARFLDSHPAYRDRFRDLHRVGQDAEFNETFLQTFADDWHEMQTEWVVFATTLDYDYQVAPMVLDFEPGQQRVDENGPATASIRSDLGWQNSGILLEAGRSYRISAQGRYQVEDEPGPWWCEPNGVTIHYNRDRPLGILLGALLVRTSDEQLDATSFARPLAIGLETTVTPQRSGTLYLRINEAPGSLHDNRGELTVEVSPNN